MLNVKTIAERFAGASLNGAAQAELVKRADAARDARRYMVAAGLYEQALLSAPPSVDLMLQCGTMHLEACNFREAEYFFLGALNLAPDDGQALLQLGSLYQRMRRYADAEHFYRRAGEARPEWEVPTIRLRDVQEAMEAVRERERLDRAESTAKMARMHAGEGSHAEDKRVDPTLYARTRDELYRSHEPTFVVTRIGDQQKTRWGTGRTVRGIDALRGYIVSPVPYLYIEIYLDGILIYKRDLLVAPQPFEKTNPDMRKYVYNAWIDFSTFAYGWHELIFSAVSVRGEAVEGVDWKRERIIVAESLPEGFFADSDAIVPPIAEASNLTLEEQINARPSIVHQASIHSFPGPIRTVAVLRTDQLGDMVVAVPAFISLRKLLPEARLVGLMSPANADLARSLGVFDEVIVLDFPEDSFQRQRIMDEAGQEKLIRRLATYKFDLAMDFVVNGVSKRLVAMTGAPVTMGYGEEDCKTFGLDVESYDFKSNNNIMHHSVRLGVMVKSLELWLQSQARIVRRSDLDRAVLSQYGLGADEDYVLLHSGSRIKFTQWPHYAELAGWIAERLHRKVVLMADNDDLRSKLPPRALDEGRIIYMTGKLPFDHFDAFVSFCSAFVGNDSGPKHLAGLRGAKVVSLHSSRIAWGEWGQEQTGVIISRQVPCAGCCLHHDPEECAQDVACMKYISVVEVFREVEKLLTGPTA